MKTIYSPGDRVVAATDIPGIEHIDPLAIAGITLPAETREPLIQALGVLMSDLSEECWCAGWTVALENTLPRLCVMVAETNEPQQYGQGLITREMALPLLTIAGLLGHWATYNMGDGPEYLPYSPDPPHPVLQSPPRSVVGLAVCEHCELLPRVEGLNLCAECLCEGMGEVRRVETGEVSP